MDIYELDNYRLADAVKFHTELNPALWEGMKMRPEVREALLRIAQDFQEFMGINDIALKDITVSGSNAAYSYTPHSDIDLHLIVDLDQLNPDDVYRELFDAKKYQYNDQHDIKIHGYDVELYVQDANQKHFTLGEFSVMKDDWIRIPTARRTNLDDMATKNKFEKLGHLIELALQSNDLAQVENLIDVLRKYRKAGLNEKGEFGPENLAYKILRKQGLIQKLYDHRNNLQDRKLSLEGRKKKAKKKSNKKKFRYGQFGGFWYPGYHYVDSMTSDSGDGGGGDGGESMSESSDKPMIDVKDNLMPLDKVTRRFVHFASKHLKLDRLPRIVLRGPAFSRNVHSFGHYVDDKKTIEVEIANRHIMDILRTLAHELTHYKQHQTEKNMPASAGETGSPYENEANAVAGVIMRHWQNRYPEFLQAKTVPGDEPIDEGWKEKIGAAALAGGMAMGAQAQDAGNIAYQIGKQIYQPTGIFTRAGAQEEFRGIVRDMARGTYRSGQPILVGGRPIFTRPNQPTDRVAANGESDNLNTAYAMALDSAAARARQRYGDIDLSQWKVSDYQVEPRGDKYLAMVVLEGPKPVKEDASGYIPTKAQAKDPRFKTALTVDVKPGQVGKEANKLKLKTNSQGQPQIAKTNGLFETLYKEYHKYKTDEDYSPDEPPGPEFKPTMPAGTLRVDVSDVYDWYKLGQHISNLKGLGRHDFGAGPPSTIFSFGDEDTEHKFIKDLEATGLDVTDIDPVDPVKRPGRKIKTDPTYNVDEAIQAPVSKQNKAAEDYYKFIVGKIKLGRVLNRQEQEFLKMYNLKKQVAEYAVAPDRRDDESQGPDYVQQLANRWWNAADPKVQKRIADVIRTFGYAIEQIDDDTVQLTDIKSGHKYEYSDDEFDPDLYEVSADRLQQYLSRAGQQVDRRQERMSQARERLNKGYEIYDAEDPTRIVHRFEADTPAEAQRYYETFIDRYESDRDFDLQLRRSTGLMETAQGESEQQHGWRAELVDEISPITFEVRLTNRRSGESANFVVRPADLIRQGLAGKFYIDSMDIQDLQTGTTRSIVSDDPAPWVYILDAVDALFYDTPALQARLEAQLKAHQDKGLPMLPGLKKREHFGQGIAVKDFVQGQQAAKDAVARAQGRQLDELALKSTLPVTQTMDHPAKQVYDMKTQSGEYRIVFVISNKDDPDYDDPTGYLLDILLLGRAPDGSWTQWNTNVGEKEVAKIYSTIAQLAVKVIKAHPEINEIEIKGADPQRSRIYSRLMQQNIDSLLPGWKLGGEGLVREKPQQAVAEVIKMPPVNMVFSNENLVDWAYNDAKKKQARQLQSLKTDVPTRVYDMGDHVRAFVMDDQGPVLYLALEKFLDGFKTNAVQIHPRGQGKNLAFKVYQAVSDTFQRPLYSDQTHTDASRLGIWKKLIDKFPNRLVGYDQATREDLPLTSTDQGPVVRGKEPIYVQKKKKDLAKPVTPQTRSRTRLLKFLPATATQAVAESVLNETQTVTRIDSKPITDFASNLKSYKHTDDWSQSGIDTGDDSYWQKRNIKPKVTKGLYAGDPHRTALYATGNAHETRYVEFTQNGQPIVYFDRKDLPKMRARKTYLTVFNAANFKKLPTGEYFSDNPGQPIKQTEIGDPFQYIANQGWIVRTTDNLDKVLKQVQAMHKAGKISQYGAEGMNESVEELDEVKMSPSALEKFATSKEAQGIRAGFEAELIFRDTQGESDEEDPEPDYDADERAYSIQQVIEFFDNDEYGYGLSDRERNRLEENLDETYMNWRDEQMTSDFRNDAEDLIRDVLLAETPMSERIGLYLTDSMQKSDEEADRILAAGADAPRFTKSADQEAYAAENPDYAVYLEAAEGAEAELDESVEDSVRQEDGYWDEALDEYRDNYSGDDDSFFSDVGLRWMSDIANEYNLDWPVWNMDARGNDGSRDWEDIGSSLQDAVDMPVKVSTNYHSAARREGTWIIEPDGSLHPDDKSEEMGLEIVSPPMPLLTAIEKLKQVTDWANDPNGGNAYTNSTTGLHMGVSLPGIQAEDATDAAGIDYVKLILFLGDKYVQQQFGRSANNYCASAMDKLKQNIKGGRSDPAGVVELLRHGLTELAYKELQKGVGTSKYTSAHIQPGYIEFRSPGGDWLAKSDEDIGILENTMLRFARAMAIAGDPSAERQEYAKKLYKLVTQDNPQYADQLRLFSEFSAGTINKEQLKKQWADTVLQKEIPSAGKEEFEVFRRDNKDSPDGIVGTLYAQDYDSAYDLFLRQYGRDINDLDVRTKLPWFDVFDATGKILMTMRAPNIDKATQRIQYEYGERSENWNIYRRPDNTPEPKVSPRAQVAKRIVKKPQTPTQFNYEVVDRRTGRVVDKFYAERESTADAVYNRWLQIKNLPNDTEDYGYRKSEQAADDQRDSVAIQRTLGVRDVDTDVAQNFGPRRQNYELVSDEDPDRVVHRMDNATADEVRAWIAQQEAGGMPAGFLRTRIVAEAIDPVSGAGAVPPRQDPKSIGKKAVTPVEKANLDAMLTHDQPSTGLPYKSAIGNAISQSDLENMTRQIQAARKLGDSIMEMEDTPPEVLRALDQAAQKNGYKNWADVKANPRSNSAVITVAKLASTIMRTTGPHHEKLFYKNKTDVDENFADGKKPGRKGLAKRMGVPTKASVSRLRQIAKSSTGEKARMAHWMANMKSGRAKKK